MKNLGGLSNGPFAMLTLIMTLCTSIPQQLSSIGCISCLLEASGATARKAKFGIHALIQGQQSWMLKVAESVFSLGVGINRQIMNDQDHSPQDQLYGLRIDGFCSIFILMEVFRENFRRSAPYLRGILNSASCNNHFSR